MLFRDLMHLIEKEHNIAVSLEVCHPVFLHCEELKLAPDQYLHHIPFCRAAKQHDGNQTCSGNKKRSCAIAGHGHCFCGKCPFGILEYAAPVRFENRVTAVLYVGGLVHPDWTAPDFFHGEPPRQAGENWREELGRYALFLRQTLEMELRAVALRGGMNRVKRRDEDFYVRNCLAFINDHYQDNIALADLADLLSVNPNYLGGLLRRYLHTTFRRQLLRKRLEEAETLLRFHPQLSIGEIAFKCGFSDSNYFSAQFHRERGMSPTDFRKRRRDEFGDYG